MPHGGGLTETCWKLILKQSMDFAGTKQMTQSKAVKVQQLHVLDCVLLPVLFHGRAQLGILGESHTLTSHPANVLYSIPAEVMHKEIIKVPESCYGDHQLAMAYHSQLNTRSQLTGESAAATEQITHQTLVGLPCTSSTERQVMHL
jgi:hypothetical protein